ncbi:MAG TPA: TfoX/Sxy family protein [Xanthobacteraceae bacterium]|nr:TfoX/Sxy family protein [Xanthobacteraceae bacterium]
MDAEALADMFAAFGPIRVRPMFGGQGIYADGLMFALVAFDDVYLKTDVDLARRLEAEGARPFVYEARGRTISMGYWTLPTERIDDPEAVAEVARLALGVARRAAEAKPVKKRGL